MSKLFLKINIILIYLLMPVLSQAGQTAGDLLKDQLDEKGINNSNQVIKSVDNAAGGSFSAIPLYDRIDFSSMPYAKIDAGKISYPACLVLTPEAVNYVFKGKPESFQGSFRKYEFHIGEGLKKAAEMIYPQVFEKITEASSLSGAGPDSIAIVPETVEFSFRMGGMVRPSLIASIKIRVGMYHGGLKYFEKIYEVNDVKKSSYTIFPSKKQEHKAISKAIIDTLKLNAEELGGIPELLALINESSGQRIASVPAIPKSGTTEAGAQWVEDREKHDFSESTEQWIRDNQHQINRAGNQSTREILKKEVAAVQVPVTKETPEVTEIVEEPAEPEPEESYYMPLPDASVFVPTELDKKRWAARKAQIDLARAEREKEDKKIEKEDREARQRINEEYSRRLNDNNWIYNNWVSETIIDHGENIIVGGKVLIVAAACVGPQGAATCAPVTSAMVSYGRFDSLAAGIGEGTAEYQRSGDFTKAVTKGAITGAIDQATGWAGGKMTKGIGGKVLEENKAYKNRVSEMVRETAFEKTKNQTGRFIDGALDTRIKSHIYKANKNVVRDGLKRASVDGLGVEQGKQGGKEAGFTARANAYVDEIFSDNSDSPSEGEEEK